MKSATLFVTVAAILLTSVAFAQSAGQPSPKAQRPDKLTLTECEGGDNCGTWTFLRETRQGYGKWRAGEEAVLQMQVSDNDKFVILRSDVSGAKEGWTATYEGTLVDHQLGGTFTYNYKGEKGTGFWNAKVVAGPPTPPSVMHWCAQHCNTIGGLDNGAGPSDKPHYGSVSAGSLWVVEKFTPESVVINRTDYGAYPGTAIMTGQLSPDGNSVVNGVITWTYHPCCGLGSMPFQAAWGPAISTVPGNDAERNARGPQTQSTQVVIDGNGLVNAFAKGAAEEVGKSAVDAIRDFFRQ